MVLGNRGPDSLSPAEGKCTAVGILLPENCSLAWEEDDKPYIELHPLRPAAIPDQIKFAHFEAISVIFILVFFKAFTNILANHPFKGLINLLTNYHF